MILRGDFLVTTWGNLGESWGNLQWIIGDSARRIRIIYVLYLHSTQHIEEDQTNVISWLECRLVYNYIIWFMSDCLGQHLGHIVIVMFRLWQTDPAG